MFVLYVLGEYDVPIYRTCSENNTNLTIDNLLTNLVSVEMRHTVPLYIMRINSKALTSNLPEMEIRLLNQARYWLHLFSDEGENSTNQMSLQTRSRTLLIVMRMRAMTRITNRSRAACSRIY